MADARAAAARPGDASAVQSPPGTRPQKATEHGKYRKMTKLADYLLSRVPSRDALLVDKGREKRVKSFRGAKFLSTLLEPSTQSYMASLGLPRCTSTEEAHDFACDFLSSRPRLILRCNRDEEKRAGMHLIRSYEERGVQRFNATDEGRYFWLYTGSSTWGVMKLAVLIILVLGMCLYPIWPARIRVVVWYLSVTLLLAIVGTIIAQLLVYFTCWMGGYEVWIIPNLLSDDAAIWELFTPLYTVKKSAPGQAYYRVGAVVAIIALSVWAYQQPTEFDTFVSHQKQFVEDLYAGTLLGDGSAAAGMARPGQMGYQSGRRGVPIPSLNDLDKMFADAGFDASPTASPAPEQEEGAGSGISEEDVAPTAAAGENGDREATASGEPEEKQDAEGAAAAAAGVEASDAPPSTV